MGIRGQLMWFLCFICLLLLVLFWFLCTQLLEPLYTTHIQKQLTEQADAIVQKLDDAIADGQTLSYWGFGSQLYVNSQFFNQLSSEIYENGGMSSFCVDISDVTLRQIFKVENLSYCNLHRTRPTDENSELPSYSTARAMRQLCRETGSCVRKINPPTPSGTVELMVGRTTSDGSYTVLVTTSLMHVSEAGEVMSTVLPLAAALIFAFSMSAAWLFSEWFTKPLRQLRARPGRWHRATMLCRWRPTAGTNWATWRRSSTTWPRKSSTRLRCSATCWRMSPTTCAPR